MISRNACYWIWITLSIGYNNPKVKRISEMYSDVSAFYYGGISEWRLCGIFSQKDLERFSSTGLDDAKKIVDRCIECNYSILCIDDELFPKCLYNIECPPALIYVNGVMPDIDNTFSIGIVGTRRATTVSYTHLTLPTTSRRQRQMCIRDSLLLIRAIFLLKV